MICKTVNTLDQLVERYLHDHDLAPGSAEQLQLAAALFGRWYATCVDPAGPPLDVSQLSEPLVRDFLLHCRDARANGPVSLNHKRGAVLCLWRFAADHDWTDAPQARRIKPFDEPHDDPVAWTDAQVELILRACDQYVPPRPVPGWDRRHDRALVYLLFYTALRCNACLALEWRDLESDGTLRVRATTQKHRRGQVYELPAKALAAVDQIRPLGLAGLPATSAGGDPRILAWPQCRETFYRRWKRLLQLAGLPATRRDGPQKMRRTSASYFEKACPGGATRHLGHSTPALAWRNYIDPAIVPPPRACDVLPSIG